MPILRPQGSRLESDGGVSHRPHNGGSGLGVGLPGAREFVRCGVANGPLWYRAVSFTRVSKEVAKRGFNTKKININRRLDRSYGLLFSAGPGFESLTAHQIKTETYEVFTAPDSESVSHRCHIGPPISP